MILRRMWSSGRVRGLHSSRPKAASPESPPGRPSTVRPDARNNLPRWGVGLLLLLAILSCGRQSTKPGKPVCEVTPDTLDFGHVELGNAAERTFRVTNSGTAGLQASIQLDCGQFLVLEGGGDTTIAPARPSRFWWSTRLRPETRHGAALGWATWPAAPWRSWGTGSRRGTSTRTALATPPRYRRGSTARRTGTLSWWPRERITRTSIYVAGRSTW